MSPKQDPILKLSPTGRITIKHRPELQSILSINHRYLGKTSFWFYWCDHLKRQREGQAAIRMAVTTFLAQMRNPTGPKTAPYMTTANFDAFSLADQPLRGFRAGL